MDTLPDDVLVAIMSYLDVPALLHFRLVSQRMAPLSVHPDVWRHKFCHYKDPLFCTVLRLAPCLLAIRAQLPWQKCHSLFTAPCAVKKLDLRISGREGAAAHAALLVRHHRELGRLKDIRVFFRAPPEGAAAALLTRPDSSVLFGTLASTPGLESITITGQYDLALQIPAAAGPPTLHRSLWASSLRLFDCCLAPGLQPFCDFMLSKHAATLERVVLDCIRTPPSLSTAALLLGAPHLAALCCPMFPGMNALAACASLRELKLLSSPYACTAVRAAAPAAADLLSRAHQLTSVHISYCISVPSEVELVRALSSSGQSRVQTLAIENTDLSFPQLREVLVALPLLRSLQRLLLYSAPDEVQLDVSPVTATRLTTFFYT